MKRSEAVNRIASVVRWMDLQSDKDGKIAQPSAEYLTSVVIELYDELSEKFQLRNQPHWYPEDNQRTFLD